MRYWILFCVLCQAPLAHATTAWWDFYAAYHGYKDGDWYMGSDNSKAFLAWGEAYVMAGVAAMYRTTGDPYWLDRLARHADAALTQRDDIRGVTDYRGVGEACWQNTHYQPADQPYCYVVHSGMIGRPIAEFALLVRQAGLENEVAYDGVTFGEKATAYTKAAREVVAAHDDQWNDDGYYIFRTDAAFLTYAGVDIPLNQSNAMGRLLLVLHDVTGEAEYLRKAKALGVRFKAQMSQYLWNYWGGTYSGNGEDVSHAAINVDFAVMLAERGVVFSDADMMGFSETFMNGVYLDDGTFSDFVGGGPTNGTSYRPQIGRWLRLTPWRTSVYTAVRDLYDSDYPPSPSSGSMILSRGLLAEYEPKHCEHFFYYVDWNDPEPSTEGNFRSTTAYGANILTRPASLSEGCMIPLEIDMSQRITVGQWDGAEYHRVATWLPREGHRFVPYEPRWSHVYWDEGVLYQFADPKYTGEGVNVRESEGLTPPTIISTPPTTAMEDDIFEYTAQGEGDAPFWWSLKAFPTGARMDPATGEVKWNASGPGEYTFTVALDNDVGRAEQSFVYVVESVDTGTPDTGGPEDTGTPDTGTPGTGEDDTDSEVPSEAGCSCGGGGKAWLLVFLPVWWRGRRLRNAPARVSQ